MKFLRKVTELVDKDVAENPTPFSIVGAIIPLAPFMILGDGAPADSHPVQLALALSVSICWGAFVTWRRLRHLKMEITGTHTTVGSLGFWLLAAGTVLFILLLAAGDIWLSDKIGWPEAYGFDCRGRGCFFQNLAHSPKLLRGGSAYELGLFALLWWLPAVVVGALICALLKRFRRRKHIQPMH